LAGRCPSHYLSEATQHINIKNIAERVTTILTTVKALIPSDRTNYPKLGVYCDDVAPVPVPIGRFNDNLLVLAALTGKNHQP
jgi:hypothetical protein